MAKVKAPKEKTNKERTLDLFQGVFPAIDRRNFDYWESMSDEQRKEFGPWLIQRWISGTEGSPEVQEYFIQAVNERVNMDMNVLSNRFHGHPELLWMLLASCGIKRSYKRAFVPPPKSVKKDKIYAFLAELYPAAGDQELELIRSLNSEDELRYLAESMNIKQSEIKDIFE